MNALRHLLLAAVAMGVGAACDDGDGPPPVDEPEHTLQAFVNNPNNYELGALRPHIAWDAPDGTSQQTELDRIDVESDDRFTMVLDDVAPPSAALRDGFATGMFQLIDPAQPALAGNSGTSTGDGVVAPYEEGTLLGFGVDVFVFFADDAERVQREQAVDIDALRSGLNVLVVDPSVRDCEERKAFEHDRCLEEVSPGCAEEIDVPGCETQACGDGDQLVEECGFGYVLASDDLLVRFEMLSVPDAAPPP